MPTPSSFSSRRAARDFLRRIREVYKLVAAAELSDVWLGNDVLIVGHGVTPSSRRGQPVLLSNGMYLNVELTLRAYRRPVPHLETVRATYSYQAGNKPDDRRPVFSYQFDRETPRPYPRSHLHVYASPTGYAQDRAFHRLHLPTRRITLEQIVWHLIHEHAVQPRRPDWHQILWRHETHFRDTQRHQTWPYGPPFNPPPGQLQKTALPSRTVLPEPAIRQVPNTPNPLSHFNPSQESHQLRPNSPTRSPCRS